MIEPQAVTIQVIDETGEIIRAEVVDIYAISPERAASDAYKEFDVAPDEYIRIIGPKGEVLYDDTEPSEEEIYEVEYEESLKHEDWEL